MDIDLISKNWKILVIDDSKFNRAIIKKNLGQLNMHVDEAGDGNEGLAALEMNEYDLILVDHIMPNLDGFGFLRNFKKYTKDRFVPVILMTGTDDLNSKIKGLRIGADDFLLKPLNEKELLARVFSLLRLKNAHDELYEKNQQIEWEMAAAKKVQQYIIPKEFTDIAYPRVSGRYLPIEDIGGDYFDCYEIDSDHTGFVIADVTGHGIPAALVMSMSKMIFNLYSGRYKSPARCLHEVNKTLMGLLLDGQYITCFYIVYRHSEKRIYFTNAGHTKSLFYRASKDTVLALDTRGLFIGISDANSYEEKSLKVEKGDRLFMYTDGLTEIKTPDKDEYGEKRLASFIKKNRSLTGDDFCAGLLNDIEEYVPLAERSDDIAFLNIEF